MPLPLCPHDAKKTRLASVPSSHAIGCSPPASLSRTSHSEQPHGLQLSPQVNIKATLAKDQRKNHYNFVIGET